MVIESGSSVQWLPLRREDGGRAEQRQMRGGTRAAASGGGGFGPAPSRDSTACMPARVKVAEMLRLLQQDGWTPAAQKQSRRRFKHPSKPGRVPVPGKPSDDLAAGAKASHFEQAGLKT